MSTGDEKTQYLNGRRRIIYKSKRGAYFVKDVTGKKYYGIKARYVAVVNGTAHKLTSKNAAPPNKIAPKRVAVPKVRTSTRKVRSNAGKKRAPYKPRVKKSPSPARTTKAMEVVTRSTLAMRLRKVTFTFKPEVYRHHGMRDEALKWFKMMASDVEAAGEVKILSMAPEGMDKIIVSFRFQPSFATHRSFGSMPRQIESAIAAIIDPDDDGNYPIMVNGKPAPVSGHSPRLLSIG